jgi:hypothetical protein
MKLAICEYLSLKTKARQMRSDASDADSTTRELLLILADAYDDAAERLLATSDHIRSAQ